MLTNHEAAENDKDYLNKLLKCGGSEVKLMRRLLCFVLPYKAYMRRTRMTSIRSAKGGVLLYVKISLKRIMYNIVTHQDSRRESVLHLYAGKTSGRQ